MTPQNTHSSKQKTDASRPKQRLTPRALLEAKRLSAPRLHPDGQRVAFVVTEADFDESRWVSHLWLTELVPTEEEGRGKKEEGREDSTPSAQRSALSAQNSAHSATIENQKSKIENSIAEDDPTRQLTFSYEGEHHPRWSPDGRYLAFLSGRPDSSESSSDNDEEEDPKDQVWVLPGDGGEARKITNAKEGVHDYHWSPDGKEIFYLTSEPRARPIETIRKEERERRKIDPVVEHDDRLRRQFWRVDVEEKKPKRLLTGDYGIHDFAPSPNGQYLAYITNYTGFWNDYHTADLYVLNLSDGSQVKVSDRPGGKYNLHWSPDGSQIAFLSWLDPKLSYSTLTLFVVPSPFLPNPPAPIPEDPLRGREGGDVKQEETASPLPPSAAWEAGMGAGGEVSIPEQAQTGLPPSPPSPSPSMEKETVSPLPELGEGTGVRAVTDYDNDLIEFAWSRRNGMFYAIATIGTGTTVLRIQPDGRVKPALEEPGERHEIDLSGYNSTFAFLQETENALPEIFLRDDFGKVYQLTRLNAEFAETYRLPRQEILSWKSPDGTPVEGVLTYPLDYEEGTRYPLILQIHGGPKGRATNTIRSYSQPVVWSAEGYAVLQPNFRGSEGYGNAFAVANRRDLGGGDFQDILSGADKCIEIGLADPERLGIMGGSYGGYMTNWAIGHSDRFKGAVSMFGIFHLQTDYSNSELSGWDNDYLGAYYWEDPDIYRQLSPGSYIENIKTPTLIIHGDEDNNTFISNSKELYQALRHRGVTTQFVHYPREGHGVSEPNHKLDEMRRCLAWMDRYVRHGGAHPGVYRIGDPVPRADGRLELCVTHAEIATFIGQPKPASENGKEKKPEDEMGLLEVQFTLHNPDTREPASPLTLTLNDVRLEGNSQSEPLAPVGVPLEVAGARVLLEGENLRLIQHPDPDTGTLAFGFAAVFRVPKSGGDCLLRVADFPPVSVLWTGGEEKEEEESEEEKT